MHCASQTGSFSSLFEGDAVEEEFFTKAIDEYVNTDSHAGRREETNCISEMSQVPESEAEDEERPFQSCPDFEHLDVWQSSPLNATVQEDERDFFHQIFNSSSLSLTDLQPRPAPMATLEKRKRAVTSSSILIQSRQGKHSSGLPVNITMKLLRSHFHETLETAAAKIVSCSPPPAPLADSLGTRQGIGKSTMKVVCRKLGLKKWPYTNKGRKRTEKKKSLVKLEQSLRQSQQQLILAAGRK